MTEFESAEARAASLACWSGPVEPEPVAGGITNTNFLVRDRGERFFVRIGEDIPVHGVLRFNEVSATRAAATAGIAPALIHSEPGSPPTASWRPGRKTGCSNVTSGGPSMGLASGATWP